MYILLTDILTCPRCGPDFGLILLADRIEERRVIAGVLGCANCREQYPITNGFGDFGSGSSPVGSGVAPIDSDAEALRLAALLGVAEPHGFVLLVGEPALHAAAVADMVPGLEVVVAAEAARAWDERAGMSRISIARRLPILGRRLRGVALSGEMAEVLLEEAARVLAPLGRLVLQDVPAAIAGRLPPLGLSILAQEGDTIVAVRG